MTLTLHELIRRRVPQLTAVYVGVSWGLVQFVSFIEDRYLVSPHWTDVTLLLVAMLLPSALLFTWNHGQPGKDALTRGEKLFIPLNVVVAAVVITILFRGRDLGAVVTTVTLEDENGETVQRTIPKLEFRRRLGLFTFDVPDGAGLEWAARSLEVALAQDLSQDLFVDVRSTPNYRPALGTEDHLARSGFKGGIGVPFALKREIAQEQNREYFVEGALTRTGDTWSATYTLYETGRGKSLGEGSASASDLLTLVDQLSLDLRRRLDIPSAHIEETPDLPIAELFTSDTAALRAYGQGMGALLDDDYEAADSLLAIAVRSDPGFAIAHFERYDLALLTSDNAVTIESLQAAVTNAYRLTERKRFEVNAEMSLIRQQPDQALQSYLMEVELFPDDIEGYSRLAKLYVLRREEDRAIAAYQRILELDPSQTEYLQEIGFLYEQLGEYDDALGYYERFREAFPNDARPLAAIARIYGRMGEHERAREQLERALALEPTNVDNGVALADLLWSTGDFEGAESQLESLRAMATTPQGRISALAGFSTYYEFRGQPSQALDYLRQTLAAGASATPPIQILMYRTRIADLMVQSGDTARADALLDQIAAELQGNPLSGLVNLGRLQVAMETARPDEIDAATARLDQWIEGFGGEAMRPVVVLGEGLSAELSGDYETALARYREALTSSSMTPMPVAPATALAHVLRLTGDYVGAQSALSEVLRASPFDPRANLEMSLVLSDLGRTEEARDYIDRALDVWADAEPGYRWAVQARTAAGELEGR